MQMNKGRFVDDGSREAQAHVTAVCERSGMLDDSSLEAGWNGASAHVAVQFGEIQRAIPSY